jgi:GTP-binding protein HflX
MRGKIDLFMEDDLSSLEIKLHNLGHSTARPRTRVFVLHPELKSDHIRRLPEHRLAEAVALAAALPNIDVLGQQVVRLAKASPGMLMGSGKVKSFKQIFAEDSIELVLVDGTLSPVQQRNLEKEWAVKILDRTGLILEIFADRARTREGVLQVELAALSYQRTRLVRAWTHLERQRGGLGFVGGPGETQIESDRRAIDDQVVRIKRQLRKVVKTRELHRAARRKVPFPVVALVGYTNAGKSSLFNQLTGAEVLAKNMLFATLDPTMRGVTLTDGSKIILSDTVGFISDLPTELVVAFRATLEEVLAADLIVHVRDISHPESAEQLADVNDIMASLGVKNTTPQIEIWNKIDLVTQGTALLLIEKAESSDHIFAVSSLFGHGIDALVAAISKAFNQNKLVSNILLPFIDGRAYAWLHEQHVIIHESQDETGFTFELLWTPHQQKTFFSLTGIAVLKS